MRLKKIVLYATLLLLFLLHNDWWLQHDGRLIMGIPAGLFYHVAYCVATILIMAALVTWAWPFDESHDEAGS